MTTEKKRWLILALSCVVLLFCGLIYSWANLSAPLTEFGWRDDKLTFNYTLIVICFALSGLLSGVLAKRFSARARLIFAAALAPIGFTASSFLNPGDSILLLYLFYGIILGSSVGIAFNAIVSTTSLWFPDKKGLCAGVMFTCYGISSFILGLITGSLMANGVDWRVIYRTLGGVCGAVIFVGATFIVPPGKDETLPDSVSGGVTVKVQNFTLSQMVRTPCFWLLAITFTLMAGIGNSAIGCCRTVLTSLELPEKAVVFFGSFISVTNSIGRITTGILADKIGFNKTRTLGTGLCIAASLLSLGGVAAKSAVLAVAGLMLCGFTFGFHATLTPSTCLDFFGPENHALNYSVINTNAVFIALFPTVFSKITLASGGNYVNSFIFLAAVALLAMALSFTVKKPASPVGRDGIMPSGKRSI